MGRMSRPVRCSIKWGSPKSNLGACLGTLIALSACDRPTAPEPRPAEGTALEKHRGLSPPPDVRGKPEQQVTYRISRGGTLRNVANLYKIHHHEVIELNPSVNPDQELEPATEVVVFKDLGRPSESVGLPHDGRILNAIPMPDGPGRKITAERWKTWGTRDTVEQLDRVLRRWSELEPKAPPILVGNLSAREGGSLAPHKSHQSGRDVDLSYVAKWNGTDPVTWQRVNAENLNLELTWRLLKLLTQESRVEVIYMDRSLQKLLWDHARRHGTIRKARLPHWLEVAGSEEALIRHVAGHKDHFHVRFACPTDSRRCKS